MQVFTSVSNRVVLVSSVTLLFGAGLVCAQADPSRDGVRVDPPSTLAQTVTPPNLARQVVDGLSPLPSVAQLLRIGADGALLPLESELPTQAFLVLRCERSAEGSSQRDYCIAQTMEAAASHIARLQFEGFGALLQAALESELNSPFQATLIYPANAWAWNAIKREIADDSENNVSSIDFWLEDDMVPATETLVEDGFIAAREHMRKGRVSRSTANVAHQMMFTIVGEAMYQLDKSIARTSRAPRANPFFEDCSPYWSTNGSFPPLPRLSVRDRAR